jgi:hypothetical protein
MARQRKKQSQSREQQLKERAASRGYTLIRDGKDWYAAIGGTRFGPMQTLDEVDEFLPEAA